jgi:hypothetical protein
MDLVDSMGIQARLSLASLRESSLIFKNQGNQLSLRFLCVEENMCECSGAGKQRRYIHTYFRDLENEGCLICISWRREAAIA